MSEEKFPKTYEVLDEWGEDIIEKMQGILIKERKRATGKLVESLDYDIIEKGDGKFELVIEFIEYGKFIISGRRKGAKMPPIDKIEKWLRTKNIKFQRKKNTTKQNAFVIAKGISKNGIKGIDFTKPYKDLKNSSEMINSISKAYKKDIEKNINDIIEKIK